MKNLFVPYEIAIIAKEKGYNELDLAYYRLSFEERQEPFLKTELIFFRERYDNHNFRLERHPTASGAICTAPLYQQLTDWLREEKGIEIIIESGTIDLGYSYTLYYKEGGKKKHFQKWGIMRKLKLNGIITKPTTQH